MRTPSAIGWVVNLAVVAGLLLAGCQQSAPDGTSLETANLKQLTVSVTGMS